ncbi:hypothetical protein [Rhodopila sp.]|uniref:hypothetical protein n=1 Tax=Rhodopila sp. TaxID=2480087 RepID=UPI003D131BFB
MTAAALVLEEPSRYFIGVRRSFAFSIPASPRAGLHLRDDRVQLGGATTGLLLLPRQ